MIINMYDVHTTAFIFFYSYESVSYEMLLKWWLRMAFFLPRFQWLWWHQTLQTKMYTHQNIYLYIYIYICHPLSLVIPSSMHIECTWIMCLVYPYSMYIYIYIYMIVFSPCYVNMLNTIGIITYQHHGYLLPVFKPSHYLNQYWNIVN